MVFVLVREIFSISLLTNNNIVEQVAKPEQENEMTIFLRIIRTFVEQFVSNLSEYNYAKHIVVNVKIKGDKTEYLVKVNNRNITALIT